MDFDCQQYSAELRALAKRLRRVEDRQQIEDLVGRFQYYASAFLDERIADELFSQDPEASIEDRANGVHVRRKYMLDYLKKLYGASDAERPGRLRIYNMTTPVIRISEDGESAYGVWMSNGIDTAVFEKDQKSNIPSVEEDTHDYLGKKAMVHWVWQKFGIDFVRERDRWRIMHLHIYDVMRCPFYDDWVSFSEKRHADIAKEDSKIRFDNPPLTPTYPTAFHYQYTIDAVSQLQPEPPKEDIGTDSDERR